MTTGLLLIVQMILYHMTAAAVYEISEVILYEPDPTFLSGFRNIIDKDFIIGGLFPVYDCRNSDLEDLEMLEAMLFAIDRINNDMNLLPNLTIGYDVRDSCNSEIIGLNEALDFELNYDRSDNISFLGIVGPAYTSVTHSVASLLSLGIIEMPLISYASTDAALSNKDLYGYLLRTIPSDTLQANAMIDLVSYFGWEYVSVIFNDNDYGVSASNAFIDIATGRSICIDAKIPILSSRPNETIAEAVKSLLKSKATGVIVFTDEKTIVELFVELNKTNSTRKFVWIASDRWANSHLVLENFTEIARGMYAFQSHVDHVKEFDDYFSQLTPSTNIRNPFFHDPQYNDIYYHLYCNIEGYVSGSGSGSGSGVEYDCPDDLTAEPGYSQGHNVSHVIDAVYAFAHALQNFLDFSCDSPIRWNRTAQQCNGMKYPLTGRNLLYFLYHVAFIGIQNHIVSFDQHGDPLGAYEIKNLQKNESGQYEYVSVGFWNSAYNLMLNNNDKIEKITSRCSDPCSEGMMVSITNQNCPLCFECIPCVGPTYSMNSTAKNCSLCDDNHWGNNPLTGSTHCVPVKAQHFNSGWSIVSMCIATIALIILAAIIVIFIINWQTPVVKSSGREQMVMLLVGIGICCVLIFVIVSPPSTVVCVFQRIGVPLSFSLTFGALFVKIVRVARIFYWDKSVSKGPPLTEPKYQVMFTIAIVAGQLILVVIGLGMDPPAVKRDSNVVITTSVQQIGHAPTIVRTETCQQPHTAIVVLLLVYNFFIIVGCTILGWMTRNFPENFNEARHVMFTVYSLMVVWVLFVPLYFSAESEFQIGVLALGIVLSAISLMAGIFFPRVYIIIFEKHKNTKEYASQQNHAAAIEASPSINFFTAFQKSKMHNSCVYGPITRGDSRGLEELPILAIAFYFH